MDKEQALKVLGLTPMSSADDIIEAYNYQLSQQAAPTEAVRAEFETIKATLNEAKETLLRTSADNQANHFNQARKDYPSDTEPAQASDERLSVGSILASRYEIKEFIHEDSLSLVYRAFDSHRQETVALKIMQSHLMQTDIACEQFLKEAWLSSQLKHPNIVTVFDVQQLDGLCFLAMEPLDGQTLRTFTENRKLAGQPFSLDEVIEILTPICDALDTASQMTVHRDIRPENIFLTDDGQYKLMNFGIARVMSISQRMQTGAACYLAPEQLKATKPIDSKSDQYALGVLAYELLSGKVPTGTIQPLHELVKGINHDSSTAIQRALSPKSENRFTSLPEFLVGLQGQGHKNGINKPRLSAKQLTALIIVVVVMLGLSGLVTSGGLTTLWRAIQPVDTALIAQQKAESERLQMEKLQAEQDQSQNEQLTQKRAEAVSLESEIDSYRQQLSHGRKQLATDARDAKRDNNPALSDLQHWQMLTENALFNGARMTELEDELNKAQDLLQQNSETSIEQAQRVLESLKDAYQALWNDFIAAQSIQMDTRAAEQQREAWLQLKKRDQLGDNEQARIAAIAWSEGRDQTITGDFTGAKANFAKATTSYQAVIKVSRELARQQLMATLNRADWLRLKKQNQLVDSAQARSANANWAKGQNQIKTQKFATAIASLEQANADLRVVITLSQQLSEQRTVTATQRSTWLQLKKQGQLGDSTQAQTANKHWIEAVEHSRTGNFSAANTGFAEANQAYQAAIEQAKQIASVRDLAIKASELWRMRQSDYKLKSPPSIAQAEQSEREARSHQSTGKFKASTMAWQQAQRDWKTAYESTSKQVALIDRQRAEAKEAEQARLAAIAASEAATARKEAARLAVIATETEQKRIAALIKQATPDMVLIPSGNFQMGDLAGEGYASEKPVHPVAIQAFEMTETEITFAQWDACVSAGGCSHSPDDRGWGRENRPVINISYTDITREFIPWLNEATKNRYALPSEAQWEYAARAGSSTKYSWGDSIGCTNARYGNYDGSCDSDRTATVKSFAANAFGLYDMHGNVREWVEDCWNDNYTAAPSDGTTWQSGDCTRRVLRGSAWYDIPSLLRSAFRFSYAVDRRGINSGFRLVQNKN